MTRRKPNAAPFWVSKINYYIVQRWLVYIFICYYNWINQKTGSSANANIRAVFLHILADTLGSVAVILSSLANIYNEKLHLQAIVNYIDPFLSLILITLILSITIPLCKISYTFYLFVSSFVKWNVVIFLLKSETISFNFAANGAEGHQRGRDWERARWTSKCNIYFIFL